MDSLLETEIRLDEINDIENFFDSIIISDENDRKNLDLLISLFIGSINDIDRVKDNVPETTLDKVKQKIQLFDGDQTRFVYQKAEKKRIRIQGLSGTGKTELLLHKLKDLYIGEPNSTIYFTCHNKILADNLRKRIPDFFNFMKVEQQIEWNKRLGAQMLGVHIIFLIPEHIAIYAIFIKFPFSATVIKCLLVKLAISLLRN